MPRQTLKSLHAVIIKAEDSYDELHTKYINLQAKVNDQTRSNKNTIINKDAEIHQLQQHIGFVHAQRDRLLGFIEGRESMVNPEIDAKPDYDYASRPTPTINRFERFFEECSQKFIRSDSVQVRNDDLRYPC